MSLVAIQHLVASGRYRYSQEVRTLIEDGWFDEEDWSPGFVATRIHKRARDEFQQVVPRIMTKYVIIGEIRMAPFYTAGKILTGSQGQIYFFITAHQATPRR